MGNLDLYLDRQTVVAATRKAKIKTPDIGLDEAHATVKGLPRFGYVLYWPEVWATPAVYKIAITGKKKIGGRTSYSGRYDSTLRMPGRRPRTKMPDFCDGEPHAFDREGICFTVKQLQDLWRRYRESFQRHIDVEARRVVSMMRDLGNQARWVTEHQEKLRQNDFPYSILSKMK